MFSGGVCQTPSPIVFWVGEVNPFLFFDCSLSVCFVEKGFYARGLLSCLPQAPGAAGPGVGGFPVHLYLPAVHLPYIYISRVLYLVGVYMAKKGKGSGWHGESVRHKLAGMGYKTVLPDGRRLDVSNFVARGRENPVEVIVDSLRKMREDPPVFIHVLMNAGYDTGLREAIEAAEISGDDLLKFRAYVQKQLDDPPVFFTQWHQEGFRHAMNETMEKIELMQTAQERAWH